MKKILSLFIILLIALSILSSCSLLPEDLKFCKVNFYVDGELYDTQSVAIGTCASKPTPPQKTNEIFIAWETGGFLGQEFDFSSKLISDVNLYAHYVIDAVSFNDTIMNKTIKSIVTIENKSYNNTFIGVEVDYSVSQGSGVIVDISGGYCYVLTNYHVTEKASGFAKQSFSVEDPWGNTYEAQIYKNALSNEYDLALLYFRYPTADSELEEITFGTNPRENAYIAAIGTPEGLKNAITYGTVIEYEPINPGNNESLQRVSFDVIVHDASIYHGSSGGALINTKGELVGINFAGYGDGEYGCAIPIEKVIEFMNIYVY